jgi:hypothetical protein
MDVNERTQLANSIVAHVADYRIGEIVPINKDRVVTWLNQFDQADQPTILRETERLLGNTYISRTVAKTFIDNLATNEKLTGGDAKTFWSDAGFLRLQSSSRSQADMLNLLGEVLNEKFSLKVDHEESKNSSFVYLDDAVFSGNQIRNDLARWVGEKDIRDATVHVIAMAIYLNGQHYAKTELLKIFSPRNINLEIWSSIRLENRLFNAKEAEVFWPTQLPDEACVNQWKATFPAGQNYFSPRPPAGGPSTTLFSSEESREIIEQAFLKKGAYIYSLPQNPQQSMRPLGYSRLRTPGFGSTLATFRNCPNNAPLVLWWGDPDGRAPLNQWTPLLPRRPRN